MGADVKKIGKTTLRVAGAACVATGIVAASAVIASGVAVGSIAEGFKAAKKAVADMFHSPTDEIIEVAEESAKEAE